MTNRSFFFCENCSQWLGAPSCLRGAFAFYKSVSCEALAGAPALVWKLGEFYYVRCGPQEPVCIAEVRLPIAPLVSA